MGDTDNNLFYAILDLIACKEGWHEKVFNDDLVQKWYQEIITQSKYNDELTSSYFWLAIQLLRATSQGSFHLDGCGWSEDMLCDQCTAELRVKIVQNFQHYNFDTVDEARATRDDDDDFINFVYDMHDDGLVTKCEHTKCTCVPADHCLEDYVAYHKNSIYTRLKNDLLLTINRMRHQEIIDWHPNSNEMVRDIIHPSMYCYVKGQSILKTYGRPQPSADEKSRYQWLPSVVTVDMMGRARVETYINNLNTERYPEFVPLIEELFTSYIPDLEHVMKKSLTNRALQVIVKVGSIHLRADGIHDNYNGGSWHIEGMPYEHIAATALHYLEVEGMTDSFLEFRKPVFFDEDCEPYEQNDEEYAEHHIGIEPGSFHDGLMNRYLGMVKATEGASVVFPNTLQHRVREFKLLPDHQVGTRTIIAFFVIDPDNPIVSTGDVDPQQTTFTHEEALHYRERLMYYRKYFVDEINEQVFEREYSLCEH